jgi:peroxygenase
LLAILDYTTTELFKISPKMLDGTQTNTAKIRERKPKLEAAKENNETVVVAEKSLVTSKRLPAVSLADVIENPGVARANVSVSVDKPEGDLEWARKNEGYVCPLNGTIYIVYWRSFAD